MRITDLLAPEAVELGVSVASKSDAIEKLISLHAGAGNLRDVDAYREAILAREAGGTTAIGEGMAIPHAKTDAVANPALAAITVAAFRCHRAPMPPFSTLSPSLPFSPSSPPSSFPI